MVWSRWSARGAGRAAGFTLVELLVVIGIIGVLIGILVPTLNRARASARAVVCESNLRQIGQGFAIYVAGNKGALPAAGEDGDPLQPVKLADARGWESEALWMNAISKAVTGRTYDQIQVEAANGGRRVPVDGDHNILVCPGARATGGVNTGTDADEVTADGYFLMHGYVNRGGALVDEPRRTFICYAMNYKLFGTNVFAGRAGRLRPASDVVVVFEKRTNAGEVTVEDDSYYASVGGGTGKITTAPLGRFKGDWKRLTTRHEKGGYLLFADGHVKLFTLKEAMTPAVVGVNDWNRPGDRVWNVMGAATK